MTPLFLRSATLSRAALFLPAAGVVLLGPLLPLPVSADATIQLDPDAVYEGVNNLFLGGGDTNPGGDAVGGSGTLIDLNAFLGAGRYYTNSTPVTGQNTLTTNLEAGYIWTGHEALQHAVLNPAHADTFGNSTTDLIDRHATWVSLFIGGRQTALNPQPKQQGIAYGTNLHSAAIASVWAGPAWTGSFNWTTDTLLTGLNSSFGSSDVINSSYGYADGPGTHVVTIATDAYAFQNPNTTYVTSAGNSGPGSNTVGAPGSGYNSITVAALDPGAGNTWNTVSSFSSRGPQDFGYRNESGNPVTVAGVRAAVDIAAPGNGVTSAFYGGQTGGNNLTLSGSTDNGSNPNAYSSAIAGTSFAAPLVAGGAALVASAAKTLPELSGLTRSHDSMVIKSLLLTGADKTSGWTNALHSTTDANGTYALTTQSLDYATGAGRMNLDQTFDIQVNGTRDVTGETAGFTASILNDGWDYGHAVIGQNNDYVFTDRLAPGSQFTTTVSWQRARLISGVDLWEVAQADLTLSLWGIDYDSSHNPVFSRLIARSASDYNTVEHISFQIPAYGFYGLRVSYSGNTYDNSTNDVWGNVYNPQSYGLAWSATGVPEPSTVAPLAALMMTALGLRTRRKR